MNRGYFTLTLMSGAPYRSELYVSWDEIQNLCTSMAREILACGLRRPRLLAITRGGLFPAGLLARELDVRLIDTAGMTAYSGQTVGEPKLIKPPAPEFLEDTLVIDDLVDTGATLAFLRPLTKNCTFAAVFAKPRGRPQVELAGAQVAQDVWVRFPWDTRRQFVEPLFNND